MDIKNGINRREKTVSRQDDCTIQSFLQTPLDDIGGDIFRKSASADMSTSPGKRVLLSAQS